MVSMKKITILDKLHTYVYNLFTKYNKNELLYGSRIYLFLFYWMIHSILLFTTFMICDWPGVFTILIQTAVAYSLLCSVYTMFKYRKNKQDIIAQIEKDMQ